MCDHFENVDEHSSVITIIIISAAKVKSKVKVPRHRAKSYANGSISVAPHGQMQ